MEEEDEEENKNQGNQVKKEKKIKVRGEGLDWRRGIRGKIDAREENLWKKSYTVMKEIVSAEIPQSDQEM